MGLWKDTAVPDALWQWVRGRPGAYTEGWAGWQREDILKDKGISSSDGAKEKASLVAKEHNNYMYGRGN